MPELRHRYVNRSAFYRERERREAAKKKASWEALKAQVAAKYSVSA